jgi:Lysyl oxidase
MHIFAKVAGSVLLASGLFLSSQMAAEATSPERLPDLRMLKPSNFYIQTTSTGDKRLRFQTVIWNAGPGKFGVKMARPDTTTKRMTVSQRVYRSDGTWRSVSVPDTYGFYAGDGHNHWHLYRLQRFTIRAVNADGTLGPVLGSGAKTGFCFTDNTKVNLALPYAPESPHYTGCGTTSTLSVLEGLSVGWGDKYSSTTAYQWIKINGLKDGKYRVYVYADPYRWFIESNDTNNSSYSTIQITGNTVTVS